MIEHMDGYFVDWGESVVFGTSTSTVLVDMPTIEQLDSLAKEVVITAKDADVSAVVSGSSAIVRGATYTVRAVLPDGSGMTSIYVSKP